MEEENDVEQELEKLRQERDSYLDGWKRAKADFLNYKKEEAEKIGALMEYTRIDVLSKVFPIFDNLIRAEREITEAQKKSQFGKGFLQIIKQWSNFLKDQGIKEIETEGNEFDPKFHEAVGEMKGKKAGMVAEEVEKGYTIEGKVLRPAKVKVTKQATSNK